jgi:hypothetical protein
MSRRSVLVTSALVLCGCGGGGSGGGSGFSMEDLAGDWTGTVKNGPATLSVDSTGAATAKATGITIDGQWKIANGGAVTGAGTCWASSGSTIVEADARWKLVLSTDKARLSGTVDCTASGLHDLAVDMRRPTDDGGRDASAPDASDAERLSCSTETSAKSCTNGAIAQIDLGMMSSAADCHDQCEVAMPAAGMASGCWILASGTFCFCRSGELQTGDTYPGGTCH